MVSAAAPALTAEQVRLQALNQAGAARPAAADPVATPMIAAEPGLPTVAVPQLAAPDPAAAAIAPAGSATLPIAAAAVARLPPAPPVDAKLFPRYDVLAPNVAFWTRVFGQYSINQSVIHSSDYPNKVFEVLDFSQEAATMDLSQLARYRNDAETRAKARWDQVLAQVQTLREAPAAMNEGQRRVYQLYADVPGDDRYQRAIGTLRSQRGLRERTALALETSGNYLPEMESTFRRYGLPAQLTRLPLVESSFNVEAYSKVGAAGLWQFMPSSARFYMRLNDIVDDRRDPWTSTDAAARHLRDDYDMLGSWPLALTAYNHGRGGIARGLQQTGGSTLPDLIRAYDAKSFGFASRNFYAEFLAASDVERNWKQHFADVQRRDPLRYDTVETKNYVPYETLRRLCNADDEVFRRLNPAYRPEVIAGKLYVPPGHLIRVPAGSANAFNVAYAKLGRSEVFDAQRSLFIQHKVAKGESIGRIAKKYGVTQAAILRANGFRPKAAVRVGQVIKVPPREEARPGPVVVAVGESKPTLTRAQADAVVAERVRQELPAKARAGKKAAPAKLHKVRSGQTLTSIARLYRVSVADLRSANGLSGNHIDVGQKLKIPAS